MSNTLTVVVHSAGVADLTNLLSLTMKPPIFNQAARWAFQKFWWFARIARCGVQEYIYTGVDCRRLKPSEFRVSALSPTLCPSPVPVARATPVGRSPAPPYPDRL